MERLKLLISDVDGTLLGDEAAVKQFRAWWAESGHGLRLAYSSGRFVESLRLSIQQHGLPEPDALIGGVGTQILDLASGELLPSWPPTDDGWDPIVIRRVCEWRPELAPQPSRFSSDVKVSYYGFDLEPAQLQHLSARLRAAGQNVNVLYSSQRDVDILPAGVDKGAAAMRLCQAWGLTPAQAAVAGDSGNDLAMFRNGFRGIVVGNAHPELRSLTGPNIYQARAAYAAGVIEGLEHWMAAVAKSLQPVA